MAGRRTRFEEALWRFEKDVRVTKRMLAAFFGFAVVVRVLGVRLPVFLFVGVTAWFLTHLFRIQILRRMERISALHRTYFFFSIIDFVFLTVITYAIGVSDWLGPMFFLIVLAMGGLLLPKAKALLLSFLGFAFYTGLVAFDYFGLIPHRSLFPGPPLYQSPYFVLSHVVVTGVIFYFVGEVVGSFSEALRKRTKELAKERRKAEAALSRSREMENILKIRVKARTRELRELVERREKVIEERTEELEKRVKELKKFRELTVGRELKMIELKDKIEELKSKVKGKTGEK